MGRRPPPPTLCQGFLADRLPDSLLGNRPINRFGPVSELVKQHLIWEHVVPPQITCPACGLVVSNITIFIIYYTPTIR